MVGRGPRRSARTGQVRGRVNEALSDEAHHEARRMVGRGGLEPPTSRLSGVRSNHLSYRPKLQTGRSDVYLKRYEDRLVHQVIDLFLQFCLLRC